jgi:hypothetical protein
LISLDGKVFPRVAGGFETDQSSDKRVNTKLHRQLSRLLPLRLLLLTANRKVCKE